MASRSVRCRSPTSLLPSSDVRHRSTAAIAFAAPLFGASNLERLLQSPRQTKASGFLRNRTLMGTPLSVPRIRHDGCRTKGGRICVASSNPLRPCTANAAAAN